MKKYLLFIILTLSPNLFSQDWFESEQWPKFNKNHRSEIKINQKDLSPLIDRISSTSHKNFLNLVVRSLRKKNLELHNIVRACKFKDSGNNLRSQVLRGQTVLKRNRSFRRSVKKLEHLREIQKLKSQKEKTYYALEEIFGKYNYLSTPYKYELDITPTLFVITQSKNESHICINHKSSIEEAASTLIHELIHYQTQTEHQHKFEDLFDSERFLDLSLHSKGGELEAFKKQCEFEIELTSLESAASLSSFCSKYKNYITNPEESTFIQDVKNTYNKKIERDRYKKLIRKESSIKYTLNSYNLFKRNFQEHKKSYYINQNKTEELSYAYKMLSKIKKEKLLFEHMQERLKFEIIDMKIGFKIGY